MTGKKTLYLSILIIFSLLVFKWYFTIIKVNSTSMEKSLPHKTIALILKGNTKNFKNTIVVYEMNNQKFVKRIKGMPGDTIKINKLGIELHNEISLDKLGALSVSDKNENNFSGFNDRFLENYLVPFMGMSISLNSQNLSKYKHLIEIIEGCELTETASKYYLCGTELSKYIFPENTYYLMGDNRSHSKDSRYFGAIPKSKIIGKHLMTIYTPDN